MSDAGNVLGPVPEQPAPGESDPAEPVAREELDERRIPFTRRTTVWLLGLGLISFVAAFGFAIFGDDVAQRPNPRANAYSRSAIGHQGFVRLLRKLDIATVVSRYGSAEKVRDRGVLIVADPAIVVAEGERADALRRMLMHANASLYVLPKWYGRPAQLKPSWINSASLRDVEDVAVAMQAIGLVGEVVREGASGIAWSGEGISGTPALSDPQLIRSDEVTPEIWTDAGILLGRIGGEASHRWILADPDLLANHGLGRGDNARLAVAIVDRLRDGGPVIIDETMHGYHGEPSIWRALFEPPLVLATLQALVAVGLLLWAGVGRFGAPSREGPGLEPGKAFLIRNISTLLQFGGHTDHSLQRYLRSSMRDVARDSHAPTRLGDAELRAWLEQVGRTRGATQTLARLEAEVASAAGDKAAAGKRTVNAAYRIYRWKREMIHGSSNGSHSQ